MTDRERIEADRAAAIDHMNLYGDPAPEIGCFDRLVTEDIADLLAALAAREEALAAVQAENERLRGTIAGAVRASDDWRLVQVLERALASRPGEAAAE